MIVATTTDKVPPLREPGTIVLTPPSERPNSDNSLLDLYIPDHDCQSVKTETEADHSIACNSTSNLYRHDSKTSQETRHRAHFTQIWTAIVLTTSLYSTSMSGIWFLLAITSFRYNIGQPGALSYSNASTIIAAGAKSIELSFEFVAVAVVGQELTRRMTARSGRGINLAQMQLKAYLAQPGSMITNWGAFLKLAPTILGVASLFVGAIANLYTTASDALVAPRSSIGDLGFQDIPSITDTSFFNSTQISHNCASQMGLNDQDPASPSVCDDLLQAGLSFQNFVKYKQNFQQSVGNIKDNLTFVSKRPSPVTQVDGVFNTTVQWLDLGANEQVLYQHDGRTVNNITLMIPHAGVVSPAKSHFENLIMDEVLLNASISTPALNVLCSSFEPEDPTLSVIVISEWSAEQNSSIAPVSKVINQTGEEVLPEWYNGTSFDSLWQFTTDHRPPVFPNLPGNNNTRLSWSRDTNGTFYLLARAPDQTLFMCGMTVKFVDGCSVVYNSTSAGNALFLDCGPDMSIAYSSSHGSESTQAEFVTSADLWALSLSFGASEDVDGALARVLTTLWSDLSAWNGMNPSAAEAIAVLASSVLLYGTIGAPLSSFGTPTQPFETTIPAIVTSSVLESATIAGNEALSRTSRSLGSQVDDTSVTARHVTPPHQYPSDTRSPDLSETLNARDDAAPTLLAGPPSSTSFRADIKTIVYTAGSNSNAQQGFFVVLMGAWAFNCLFLTYVIATLIARRRSRGKDLGSDADSAGAWTLRTDLADSQALFGLALNSKADCRLADPALNRLPRELMDQCWRVAGSPHDVYIQPVDDDLPVSTTHLIRSILASFKAAFYIRKPNIKRRK